MKGSDTPHVPFLTTQKSCITGLDGNVRLPACRRRCSEGVIIVAVQSFPFAQHSRQPAELDLLVGFFVFCPQYQA